MAEAFFTTCAATALLSVPRQLPDARPPGGTRLRSSSCTFPGQPSDSRIVVVTRSTDGIAVYY